MDITCTPSGIYSAAVPPPSCIHSGWDPVFEPDEGQAAEGEKKTFAQMDKETKNGISHRYKALEKLRAHLVQIYA